MKLARTLMACVAFAAIGSSALAQEPLTGTIKAIDRINGTVTIQSTQSGTVGATGNAAEEYKVQAGSLTDVHAGDRVTFTVTETGGSKTIGKLERQ